MSQHSHSFLCVFNLRDPGVSVLPKPEEFLIILDGFTFPAFLLVQTGYPVIIFRMYEAPLGASWIELYQPFIFRNSLV